MILPALLLSPLVGCVAILLGGWKPATARVGVGANGALLAGGIWVATRVVRSGPLAGWGLRADALSAFMVVVIGTIALLASWVGSRSIQAELSAESCTPRQAAGYGVLVQAFVATMLLAVLAANMGVVWVGVEATTVVTTFLVGHRRTSKALEASWKYIVICSVGVGLAFLGTVLVYFAAVQGGSHSAGALDWTSLTATSHHLNPSVMRLAFALIVLGYGTKVGLAPMHSWLPDAHSQAPAPVSALMSGVLLTVAFYAILRFKAIADVALGPAFPRALLVTVSLLSLALAASLLISQHDYKRMLAYHSIEHMGLIALGAAAGVPLAVAGLLLHMLGHGLAKSVLFLASGEIMAQEGTSNMAGPTSGNEPAHYTVPPVGALLVRRPVLGGVFGIGLVALLGLPPFSLFTSELLMARGEFQAGLGWAAIVAVIAMVVIFVAVVSHARHMLFGAAGDTAGPAQRPGGDTAAPVQRPGGDTAGGHEEAIHGCPAGVAVPLVAGLAVCAVIGVLAWPLTTLLHAAAQVVAL